MVFQSLTRFKRFVDSVDRESILKALSLSAVCLGVLLRLLSYAHDRGLWNDEIELTRNIEERSYAGLLKPLSYDQTAPIGFLFLERLAIQLLGDNEYSLRLLPLLAGLLSLLLFFRFARLYLRPSAALVAIFLFSVAGKLVYYSAEAKQYSGDVAVALMLMLFSIKLWCERVTVRQFVTFGMLGATAIWFSHPAVFILAGVGTILILRNVLRKRWTNAAGWSIVAVMWAASFIGCYIVSLRPALRSEFLLDYWSSQQAFMPFIIRPVSEATWLVRTFVQVFQNPTGFTLPVIAALIFLTGCWSAFVKKDRFLFLLLSPIPFALAASALHKYPFIDRLLLFAAPSIIVFVSIGIGHLFSKARLAGVAIVFALLLGPTVNAIHTAIRQDSREDIKLLLSHIREHWQPGDKIYVFYSALQEYWYYAEKYGFTENSYVRGKRAKEAREITADIDSLKYHGRVWAIFLIYTERHEAERAMLLGHLNDSGLRLDEFETGGLFVYLYDMRAAPSSSEQSKT